jgi:hypothetical protein
MLSTVAQLHSLYPISTAVFSCHYTCPFYSFATLSNRFLSTLPLLSLVHPHPLLPCHDLPIYCQLIYRLIHRQNILPLNHPHYLLAFRCCCCCCSNSGHRNPAIVFTALVHLSSASQREALPVKRNKALATALTIRNYQPYRKCSENLTLWCRIDSPSAYTFPYEIGMFLWKATFQLLILLSSTFTQDS